MFNARQGKSLVTALVAAGMLLGLGLLARRSGFPDPADRTTTFDPNTPAPQLLPPPPAPVAVQSSFSDLLPEFLRPSPVSSPVRRRLLVRPQPSPLAAQGTKMDVEEKHSHVSDDLLLYGFLIMTFASPVVVFLFYLLRRFHPQLRLLRDRLRMWFALKKTDLKSLHYQESICVLCQYDLMPLERLAALRACGHAFHFTCIRKYIAKESTKCPVCRTN